MRVVLSLKNIEKMLRFLFDFFMVFGFLFEFRLGMGLTTRRLVLVFAVFDTLINIGIHKKKDHILPKKAMILSINMLILVACIIMVNKANYGVSPNNTNMNIRYILYIMLYVYFFALYCLNRFDDIRNFSKVYVAVILFQSVIVFGAALNTRFRVLLFNTTLADQYEEDMILPVLNGTRICGIQLMASAGSLILCTGCLLLVYLVINKYISNSRFFINFCIISLATMLIGRTGFYIEILLILIYIMCYKSQKKYISIMIGTLLLFVFLAYVSTRLDNWIVAYYKKWIGEIFYGERFQQTLEWIGASNIPGFSKEMLLGTNVMKGILPTGFMAEADSGYVRMYCAIGLLGCMLYYGSFFIAFMSIGRKIRNKKNRLYYLLCVLFTFIIEYKEPFFMKYFFPFIVLVLGMFIVQQERKKHEDLLFDRSAF